MWSVAFLVVIQKPESDSICSFSMKRPMFRIRAAWIFVKILLIRNKEGEPPTITPLGFASLILKAMPCLISKMPLPQRCWAQSIQGKIPCSLGIPSRGPQFIFREFCLISFWIEKYGFISKAYYLIGKSEVASNNKGFCFLSSILRYSFFFFFCRLE